MTSELAVYLNKERVGTLEQDEDELLRFTYDPAWLERPEAIPLSRSLPRQSDAFSGKKARPFFAGILPEEGLRKRVSEILGISDGNDFAMLEKIGGECAGAVSLLPKGASPMVPAGRVFRELSDAELRRIVAELPTHPLMVGEEGLRLSLAGAQDKLPVVVDGGRIAMPLGDTPSTHIMKPEPDRFPGLAANEYFCMTLARAIGLDTPETTFLSIGDKPCLLVERYDRRTDESGVTSRLHQEDFCQALGIPPERKYQAEGGPGFGDCIALLREWSTAPAVDIPAFINSVIFNVLIGNADAHAKNFAILYDEGQRFLAPRYDLVSTLAWPELSRNLAMSIGGCKSVNAFTIGDWRKMVQKAELNWPMVRERMAELSRQVQTRVEETTSQVARWDRSMAEKMRQTTEQRTDRIIGSLAEQG